MITAKQRKFLDSLTDKEYREMFADELVGTSLAFQIRRLREARQLTQNDISGITGKAQPTISQWEDPNYGRYTLSTLKELASAFDVALLVRFVSFGELADWTVEVSPKRQTPPSFSEEFADTSTGLLYLSVSADSAVVNFGDVVHLNMSNGTGDFLTIASTSTLRSQTPAQTDERAQVTVGERDFANAA